jgi:hypothetical protein
VVTKLDSTAKGGVLVAIVDELEIPIKFVGLGESADAYEPSSPAEFIDASSTRRRPGNIVKVSSAMPLALGVRA